eukprot:TRINITY_DN9843_c0_g1_i1.p1 TRINITY_DN9843_c0_g1~~TRINITY_DN9843_c0_g1_i1.p1  ORF type:complete len:628 (+),score=118.23 TRINITY_DN9843_c0_g1_i1:70-1884(+)
MPLVATRMLPGERANPAAVCYAVNSQRAEEVYFNVLMEMAVQLSEDPCCRVTWPCMQQKTPVARPLYNLLLDETGELTDNTKHVFSAIFRRFQSYELTMDFHALQIFHFYTDGLQPDYILRQRFGSVFSISQSDWQCYMRDLVWDTPWVVETALGNLGYLLDNDCSYVLNEYHQGALLSASSHEDPLYDLSWPCVPLVELQEGNLKATQECLQAATAIFSKISHVPAPGLPSIVTCCCWSTLWNAGREGCWEISGKELWAAHGMHDKASAKEFSLFIEYICKTSEVDMWRRLTALGFSTGAKLADDGILHTVRCSCERSRKPNTHFTKSKRLSPAQMMNATYPLPFKLSEQQRTAGDKFKTASGIRPRSLVPVVQPSNLHTAPCVDLIESNVENETIKEYVKKLAKLEGVGQTKKKVAKVSPHLYHPSVRRTMEAEAMLEKNKIVTLHDGVTRAEGCAVKFYNPDKQPKPRPATEEKKTFPPPDLSAAEQRSADNIIAKLYTLTLDSREKKHDALMRKYEFKRIPTKTLSEAEKQEASSRNSEVAVQTYNKRRMAALAKVKRDVAGKKLFMNPDEMQVLTERLFTKALVTNAEAVCFTPPPRKI